MFLAANFRTTSIAVLLVFACSVSSMAQQPPNIIHIIADDMGWTDLSSNLTNLGNGSQFYQTPNIDRLASEGLSFSNAYATPTCVSTRMAIMSGQSGARTGTYAPTSIQGGANVPLIAPDNNTRLVDSTQTLAETMQGSGYTTAHFGKFHVAQNEQSITTQHGFDFNFGGNSFGDPGTYFASEANNQWTYSNRVNAGLDPYAEPYSTGYVADNLLSFANGADVESLVGSPKHLTDATADAAIDFMQGQLGTEEPFYMNVAFHAPHTPIEPRPDLLAKYQGILRDSGGTSPDDRHDSASYAAMLEGMDQAIGRIISYLENPDGDAGTDDSIASDTLLVFYGDNGGTLRSTDNQPLLSGKGAIDEGGIRVPMIAFQPGTVSSGVSDELVTPVDFYPTFTSLAEGSLPSTQPLDGQPIVSLTGDETENRTAAHFHFPGYSNSTPEPVTATVFHAGNTQTKVRYSYTDRSIEIHDLNADIGESNNLADANLDAATYKLGSRAIAEMRAFLDSTDAEFPRTRDGVELPAPSHLPIIAVPLDGASNSNLGVAASVEQTDDGATLTFNRDVMLKSLSIARASLGVSDSVSLTFVEGDNPFTSLDGYASDGFSLTADSLNFAGTRAELSNLNFGLLTQDEILLTAGTVITIAGSESEAVVLSAVEVAEPLSSLDTLLLDAVLDGELSTLDIDRICSATHSDTSAVELDQNADGQISFADVDHWLEATQHLPNDTDLNGTVEFADFLQLSQNFGQEATWSQGDSDCDGVVSFADFLSLSAAFGQSRTSESQLQSVPEPASHYSLFLAILSLFQMRRRCR